MLDAIVVGGGPAGASAALILGRCRRRVLVVDAGTPRNARAAGVHGFLTRDGTPPAELLRIARDELRRYETVTLLHGTVVGAARHGDVFEVTTADGARATARTLLLATGIVDTLPSIDGLPALYGRSVHACPYCDGWEERDRRLAALARGPGADTFAFALRTWSPDVVLLTNGPDGVDADARATLAAHGIALREDPIATLEGHDGRLERVRFTSGDALARDAVFFHLGQRQRSTLADRLGCAVDEDGGIRAGACGETTVPGVWVAGDASRDVQLAIVAAGEGAQAAFAINRALCRAGMEEFRSRATAAAARRA